MSDAISTSTRPDARSADRLDLGMPEEGGCASGDTMREAARKAGNSEILDQYARDYPLAEEKAGPHDQPQSMCPAFGSLRVCTLGQCVLRLRPDLHQPFLRRATHGRLRALQLRNAGHR